MKWYVSKNNNNLNRRPFRPEAITPYICVNPKYPVRVERVDASVLLDSGAFQDVDKGKRLTFEEALERQLNCERRCGFVAERIVSYDQLIDEQLKNGRKVKERWNEGDAWHAVDVTVDAAKYLASQRKHLAPRKLVLSCQGVTVDQYVECVKRVLEVATPDDVFGYGGFCIIGARQRSTTTDGYRYPDQFVRIVEETLPLVAAKGIREAHVFGVLFLPSLRKVVPLARSYGIDLSTDSSSVERNSVIEGKVWTDDGLRNKMGRANKWFGGIEAGDPPTGMWHPNILAHENIARAVTTLEAI